MEGGSGDDSGGEHKLNSDVISQHMLLPLYLHIQDYKTRISQAQHDLELAIDRVSQGKICNDATLNVIY
jgi:hypothetical protein